MGNLSGQGLMQLSEINNPTSLWRQVCFLIALDYILSYFSQPGGVPNAFLHDPFLKVREHEEEILQLRKHLADYKIKARETYLILISTWLDVYQFFFTPMSSHSDLEHMLMS